MKNMNRVVCLTVICSLISGCGQPGEFTDYKQAELSAGDSHHGHDHGEESGPKGGHVIEIGDTHSLHAELVFDKDSRDITVYFYGANVGEAAVVSGFEFELEVENQEQVIASSALPLENETTELASRFMVAGTSLPKNITSEEQLDGHMHVTFEGQEYAASFRPHSHDDHAHQH